MINKLKNDLDYILLHTKLLWSEIRGETVFITGGTGFFGKWLLQSFVHINDSLELNNKLIVLTRSEDSFLKKNPQFKNLNNVKFLKGDVRSFDFPDETIDYIIHAATEASASLNSEHPFLMYDTIVDGTKRILELGKQKKVKAILHTSSGAVYGRQPSNITHMSECFNGCPDIFDANAAYGEGKRAAEMMACMYNNKFNVPSKIARCFAFVGPYLPLDTHFAAGNFIDNVLKKNDIFVNGDGSPYRSYLYASDLMIWLWTILFNGMVCRPYNVGSDDDLTIEELANKVAGLDLTGKTKVIIKESKNTTHPLRYVPDISRAKEELKLVVGVNIDVALKKTLLYYT